MIAKGEIANDKSYIYRCGQCQNSGWFHGDPCTHCYGGDLEKLMYEFAVARGERYYALLKAILRQIGREIYLEASRIREANNKFTPVDLAYLVIKFNFPDNRMKPVAEWLQETHFMPAGMYEHLQDSGMKVKDIMSAARVRMAQEHFYPNGLPELVYCPSCGRAAKAGNVKHEGGCRQPSEVPLKQPA